MRFLSVVSSLLLLSALGFAQGERGIPGYCPYGCGPYVPMITTPSLSFATYSPNPVGATNSTTGLIAGATNATLSEINGNTSSVYTVPVWYSGGGMPLVDPATNSEIGSMRMNAARREFREHMEREEGERKSEARSWVYFASAQSGAGSLGAAATTHPAKKAYTNQDVMQQNDKNGYVHYDGKTEKIQ